VTEYCPSCFKKADFLHVCGESKSQYVSSEASSAEKYPLTSIVICAPLMGIGLDFFLPLPSSLIVSVLVSLLGSAFISFLWVVLKYDGNKTFRFFVRNLKNFIYTPNMLKIFGSDGRKNVTSAWFGFIALSTAIQVFLFRVRKNLASILRLNARGLRYFSIGTQLNAELRLEFLGSLFQLVLHHRQFLEQLHLKFRCYKCRFYAI
jgi:hypothetical protein